MRVTATLYWLSTAGSPERFRPFWIRRYGSADGGAASMSDTAPERWALILGVSAGTGAAIAQAVARDPGLHIVGFHRGNHPEEAEKVEAAVRSAGRRVSLQVADAGRPESIEACAASVKAVTGERGVGLLVHSLSGASLGHFLPNRGDAFHPKQFEKTFNCMAHSFAYWARTLYEQDMLADNARLLGLTNALHDHVLHNCGLVAAAKAALQIYARYLAIELGAFGHRVNLLQFGTVVTPALETVMGPQALARQDAVHRQMIPAGRMQTVEEVARFVSV